MKNLNKGFTLVELVIVAVILSILATVGFISYEEYITDTRDSKRLAQLTGLRDGLRLATTKGQLPFPDNNVEIRNAGEPFLYQGYAGADVLEGIGYSEATKDPLDDTYYTYLLSRNRKDFQLLGFLEEYNPSVISAIIPEGFAVDYSQRYPQTMGKKLGIVLEQNTNTPLQEISEYSGSGYMDLQDTTTNLFDAYITDLQIISGKEDELIGIIPYTTCAKIKQTNGSYGNGPYNINPSGLNPFEVYCDMVTAGGGWTLVARSHTSGTTDNFGWLFSRGSIRDDSQAYSLGSQSTELNFSEILTASYSEGKTVELAAKIQVDRNYIKNPDGYSTATYSPGCEEMYPISDWNSPCDQGANNALARWGFLIYPSNDKTDLAGVSGSPVYSHYFFHRSSTTDSENNRYGLNPDGWNREGATGGLGDLFQEQGMIFVR